MIALTDASGAAVQINAYDEYGVPAPGAAGRFGYTGQMFLPEIAGAPYHYRARQYHPGLGRFLQPDPIGYADGLNLYAYVGNDPVNWVDPTGASRSWRVHASCNSMITDLTRRSDGSLFSRMFTDCRRIITSAVLFESGTEYVSGIGGGFGDGGGGGGGGVGDDLPYHRWVLSDETECSADEAFNLLRSPGISAPGAPYAQTGIRSDVILTGNNPITQGVFPDRREIVNITQEPHRYFPGTVELRVSDLGGSRSRIEIVGQGTTDRIWENGVLGVLFFSLSVRRVQLACWTSGG